MEVDNQTLYCPGCGYNLTGLAENRCPECGRGFDPVDLRMRLAEKAPKPITLRDAIWQLTLLPAIFLVSQGLAIVTQGGLLVLTVIAGVFWLIAGAVVARKLAVRLAVSCDGDTADRRKRGPWFIPLCALGLYCCQIAIGAGPCAAIAAYSLWK